MSMSKKIAIKAVILAGGKGTRLGKLTENLPKPLVKVFGKSILEHQILLLRSFGISEIIILTGYKGEQIHKALGNGCKLGVKISYDHGPLEWNTVDRVKNVEKYIQNDFLLLYGDVMLNFDLKKFINFHNKNKKDQLATLLVHPNNHSHESDVVEIGNNYKIKAFHSKPHSKDAFYQNIVNAGVYLVSPKIFSILKKYTGSDFGKTVFPALLSAKKTLLAYNSSEYFRDMGTPKQLFQVKKDYKNGIFKKGSLLYKRPAVFLDRDGVINEEVDQLRSIDQLYIFPFAAKAIRKLNEAGYLVVIITNQPQIARGYITEEDLRVIHNKLEWQLGAEGAKIDAIYYCPHHVIDSTVLSPVKKYAVKCKCRKPLPGMVDLAVKDLKIDLSKSFFIGDSIRDAETAAALKINFLGVETGYGCADAGHKFEKDFIVYKNLEKAIRVICEL